MIRLPDGAERNPRIAAMAEQSRRWPCTQVGIGAVSMNTVDAAIELAQEHAVSLQLIGSRRQVDAAELGGGYVEGLTPQALCERVRARDARDLVLVARDHGGPWQGSSGLDASAEQAMAEAKLSFHADIDAGYDLIHIDTCVCPDDGSPQDRLLELYEDCWAHAQETGRVIAFEVGDEEQANVVEGLEAPRRLLKALEARRQDTDLPKPLFVVVQTGTKVMERRNIGSLSAPYRIHGEMPPQIHLPQVMELVRTHGTHLRQHNTDYLSSEVLGWHPRLGIHAANIAPEYGVEESLGLLAVMEGHGAGDLSEAFLTLAYDTRKWEKWELEGTDASDRERALWAGHYVFSTPEFKEIRSRLLERTRLTGDELDTLLRERIKALILMHLRAFRLVP